MLLPLLGLGLVAYYFRAPLTGAWHRLLDGGTGAPAAAAAAAPAKLSDAARHQAAAAVMQEGAQKAIGRELAPAELIYCLAVASLETSYGQAWKGAGAGSNNWGAVQARPGEPSFPHSDSYSDGRRYEQAFRTYPTPADGAADVVRHVLKHRPQVAAALGPGATVWRASLAMRRTTYFGGWCLKAAKEYGSAAAANSKQRNPTTEGELACEQEATAQHVAVIEGKQAQIAPALGLDKIPTGDIADARQWYNERSAAA